MRGSGKTDIGRKIASLLSYNFFDLDELVALRLNKNIDQIVSENGWNYFRQEEAKICESINQKNHAVISTGGGIILNEKNIENLKQNGIIIFLNCDIEVLKKRLKRDQKNKENRPTLGEENPIKELKKIWADRKGKYRSAADIVFDTSSESLDRNRDLGLKAEGIIALVKEKTVL